MNDEQRYWDKKILEWENTIYANPVASKVSLIERMGAPFRKPLRRRLHTAERLVKEYVTGKTLVDLGCGSGVLLFRLLKYAPKSLIGVDIAPSAIERARGRAAELGLNHDKIDFFCRDLRMKHDFFDRIEFRRADIVTGVGFLEYLNRDELHEVCAAIAGKKFVFARPPESARSPREFLRQMYRRVESCPGAYAHSKAEFDEALAHAGFPEYWYYDRGELRFITNLPAPPS